jgi:SpoVK/Ycf46/Vps4 family AAA+-type ATPase
MFFYHSKTLIGKAIAHESGATFFSISSSTLTSKWIGEGEKMVRTLFAVARYRSPAVVFIDEVDSLLTMRKSDENEASRRIKTEFLVQLDGAGNRKEGSHVLMVGATNRPQELDDAARRRFVKRLYVPLPADTDRETLLRNLLAKNRHSLTDKEIIKLSKATDGFSGADLKNLCTDAAMGPIRQLGRDAMNVNVDQLPPITYKHFRSSLKSTSPSVAQADLDVYLEWNQTYGTKATGGEDSESDDGSSDDEDAT